MEFDTLEVMYSNRKLIYIVQICSLVTTCIGQSLLPFWSYTEQCWQFALTIAA